MAKRLIRAHPDIRIIFITGYADDALVQHNVFGTGVPLLEKPFTPSDLLHAYGQNWMHRNPPIRVNFKNLEDVMGEDVKHKS